MPDLNKITVAAAAPASIDTSAFWARASAWASATMDTARCAATLVEFTNARIAEAWAAGHAEAIRTVTIKSYGSVMSYCIEAELIAGIQDAPSPVFPMPPLAAPATDAVKK